MHALGVIPTENPSAEDIELGSTIEASLKLARDLRNGVGSIHADHCLAIAACKYSDG